MNCLHVSISTYLVGFDVEKGKKDNNKRKGRHLGEKSTYYIFSSDYLYDLETLKTTKYSYL